MPEAFAARLAAQLLADADTNPLIVEVPNHGFSEEVASNLEKMGYKVERDEFKDRLTIYHSKPTSKKKR